MEASVLELVLRYSALVLTLGWRTTEHGYRFRYHPAMAERVNIQLRMEPRAHGVTEEAWLNGDYGVAEAKAARDAKLHKLFGSPNCARRSKPSSSYYSKELPGLPRRNLMMRLRCPR